MKVKGKGQNIELNKMNESIEIKLDEADKQTRMTEERLSNEEIFSKSRPKRWYNYFWESLFTPFITSPLFIFIY